MPNINDRPSAYIQDILDQKDEQRRRKLAEQRQSLGHRIREALNVLDFEPGDRVPVGAVRRHVQAMRALARSADDLYLHFDGLEPVAWLKPEVAQLAILDMAKELGAIHDWLTEAMDRFQAEAQEGLSRPGREVRVLQERAARDHHIKESLKVEARRQKRRADQAEDRAAKWQKATEELGAEIAEMTKAILARFPRQRTRDIAPSAEDALKAAILIEHNAVPDHGRYSGQHDCWEPHPDQPCACHDKPKVCRTCRTYTGDSVEYPCRTAEIALGD